MQKMRQKDMLIRFLEIRKCHNTEDQKQVFNYDMLLEKDVGAHGQKELQDDSLKYQVNTIDKNIGKRCYSVMCIIKYIENNINIFLINFFYTIWDVAE